MAFIFLLDTPQSGPKTLNERSPEVIQAVQKHLHRYYSGRGPKKNASRKPLKPLQQPNRAPIGWRFVNGKGGQTPEPDETENQNEYTGYCLSPTVAKNWFFNFCVDGSGTRRIRALLHQNDPSRATIDAFGGIAVPLTNDSYSVLQYLTQAFLPFISFSYRKGFVTDSCEFWDEDGSDMIQLALNDNLFASALMANATCSMSANFGKSDARDRLQTKLISNAVRLMNEPRSVTSNLIVALSGLGGVFAFLQDYSTAWKCCSTARKLAQQLGGMNSLSMAVRSTGINTECLVVAGSGNYLPREVFVEGAIGKERDHQTMLITVANSTLHTRASSILEDKYCVLSRTAQYLRCGWELLFPEHLLCVHLAKQWCDEIPSTSTDAFELAIKLWLGHFYLVCASAETKKDCVEAKLFPDVKQLETILDVQNTPAMLWITTMGIIAGAALAQEFLTVAHALNVKTWSDLQSLTRQYLWLEEYEAATHFRVTKLLAGIED